MIFWSLIVPWNNLETCFCIVLISVITILDIDFDSCLDLFCIIIGSKADLDSLLFGGWSIYSL